MQKLITVCVLGILVFIMFVIPVKAQVQCSNWQTGNPYPCADPITLEVGMCVQVYCAETGTVGSCGPGYYACNREGNCCPVGSGSGGGGGGGGGRGCSWSQVNCPAGGTRTNQVAAVSCGSSHCPAPGTAQATTGCCGEGKVDENGEWYCGNPQVTTYSCCPANTAPRETLVNGGTYTRDNGCYSPSCNDGDDLYLSGWGSSTECGRTCAYPDEERGCRGQEKIYTYGSISYCQERHIEYSCVPTCDANAWGAWGACSATCGGGTQTRTNACGTTQSQSCSTPCAAWWQVKDSDVSSRGDLTSILPPGKFFGLPGPGGYPGVAAYSETTSLTSASVSQIGWIANSAVGNPKVYDYRYFANQIPADTVISTLSSNVLDQTAIDANTTPSYGYYWYRYDGSVSGLDLTVNSNLNIGSKKAVVMVNSSDFAVNAPINLTDGQGFFLVVVNGNITVAPGVSGGTPDLEGLYAADGTFSSGSSAFPLSVRGSVAAYEGLSLGRDLGPDNNFGSPSEFFEYAPDQIMLFPRVLGSRKINWKEVAP